MADQAARVILSDNATPEPQVYHVISMDEVVRHLSKGIQHTEGDIRWPSRFWRKLFLGQIITIELGALRNL
jgi:hypothetical protein